METNPRSIRTDALLAEMAWVQRLARSLVRDANLADDVAQDAWLIALERPPRHALGGPGLRAWLARLTRTLARQSIRSDARRTLREHGAARSESDVSVSEIVARGSMHRRLVEAVMALDEPVRSAILYRYLDGMSAPEIAERCGASPAAVRQRLSRGLAELRARLDREFGGEPSAWSALIVPGSSVRIAGASVMAKTSTSLLALQVLGALAICAGITVVVSRSVSTVPGVSTSAAVSSSDSSSAEPAASQQVRTRETVRTPEPPAVATPTQVNQVSELDSLAATFLTDQPDIFGLTDAIRSLLWGAIVDPESVKKDSDDGKIRGVIRVSGLTGQANFTIAGSEYQVEFKFAKSPDPPFLDRNVSLAFRDDGGKADQARINVQYHPDTKAAYKTLGEDEERIVGWALAMKLEGIRAFPIRMRRGTEPGSLQIGHLGQALPRDENGAADLATFDAWLRLLQPYAK